MIITSLTDAASKPNPHGVDAKTLYDHDHGLISHLTILPGQSLKRHITPVDVAFYVVEGVGEVEIGEETAKVGADTLVESPAGIPHSWKNSSQDPLRILVMKLPKPTRKSKLL
ncbi:MAG: cupin domain-containing protein [Euryarchaeota archaeon]|nr:cupin domain-containing protein [Euryarchaeota archaeon]